MHRAAASAASKALRPLARACPAASRPAGGLGATASRALLASRLVQDRMRGFAAAAAGGDGGGESHDDFKPQRKAAPADMGDAVKMIDEQVKKHRIMLYMKGTPSRPQCGFSAQVVRVLHASGVDFDSVNVLDYPMIREGVKQYSNWPTIPQLYVDANFVGGCDIVTSLFQSGELAKLFEESAKKAEAKA